MTIKACETLFLEALCVVTNQINNNVFGELNEATIQHHLAMALHLKALEKTQEFSIVLEKQVRRDGCKVFPKTRKNTAKIDILFELGSGHTRCAIELKLFKAKNHREPNNRYAAYADLANLEAYQSGHCDIGFFLLFTDHRHYFDNDYGQHKVSTGDFCLREGHTYTAREILTYNTTSPHGPPISLDNGYTFNWDIIGNGWRKLHLKVI